MSLLRGVLDHYSVTNRSERSKLGKPIVQGVPERTRSAATLNRDAAACHEVPDDDETRTVLRKNYRRDQKRAVLLPI